MTLSTAIAAGTLGTVVLVTASWRLASRRDALPCPVWLRWLVELDNPFARTNRAAFIVEHLRLEPGMTVLDAGCGPGRLTIPMARGVGQSGRVLAMDIQPGMLDVVRHKAESAGLANVEPLHARLGDGRLPVDAFDRAALVTVLGEIPDRPAALAELFMALKPGGMLAVVELIFDPHFQTHRAVANLARGTGFREKALYGNRIAYAAYFEKPRRDRKDCGETVASSPERKEPRSERRDISWR